MRVGVLSNRFTYSSGNKEVEADLSEVAESIQKSLSSLGYEIIFFDVDSTDFNDFKKKILMWCSMYAKGIKEMRIMKALL